MISWLVILLDCLLDRWAMRLSLAFLPVLLRWLVVLRAAETAGGQALGDEREEQAAATTPTGDSSETQEPLRWAHEKRASESLRYASADGISEEAGKASVSESSGEGLRYSSADGISEEAGKASVSESSGEGLRHASADGISEEAGKASVSESSGEGLRQSLFEVHSDVEDGYAAYESVLQEMLRYVALEEEEEHMREAALEAEQSHHADYEPPFDFRTQREEAGAERPQQERDNVFRGKGSTLRSARASSSQFEEGTPKGAPRGRVPGERRQHGGSYFGETKQPTVPSGEIKAMEDLGRSFGIELDLATKEEQRRKILAEEERVRRREEESMLRMRIRRKFASPVEEVLRHINPESPPAVIDPYKVLGVSRQASHNDIKRIFRARVIAVHPDKNPHPVYIHLLCNIQAYRHRMPKWRLMLSMMHWKSF